MINNSRMPLLLVICGPFACGKNALIKLLMKTGRYKKCISATTRPPREDEVDGVDYIFLTRESFEQLHAQGAFLETADINEHLYGTLKSSVLEALEAGEQVLIHIDVQGVESLQRSEIELIQDSLIAIYIEVDLVESIERARARPGSMSDSELIKRIITREKIEEPKKHICDYRIKNPNGGLHDTFNKIERIIIRREVEFSCDR